MSSARPPFLNESRVGTQTQRSYELPAAGEVYIPYQQYIFVTFMSTIVVRTEGEPTALALALQKDVWAVDPDHTELPEPCIWQLRPGMAAGRRTRP
jgi:hypothetical protein